MSGSKRKKPRKSAPEIAPPKRGLPRGVRLVLGNLGVFLVLLLLVFAAGEIYYRYIFDSTDSFGLTRICKRWFERHYQYNAMNVRDSIEYAFRREAGRRRITFLGDSFTAGHGIKNVEDRFANRIRFQSLWEVHVMAANGLDTGEELNNLGGIVNGGYELDVLVLAYILNDISDIVPEWRQVVQRVYGDKDNEPWWVRSSYFLNTLYYRHKASRDPDVANYYGFVKGAYAGPIWDKQRQRLAALNDFCRAKGITLLVVTFPFLHALDNDYAYDDVHDQLNQLWVELNVPHLDLLNVYGKYQAKELIIGKYDAHPNELAHEMAAAPIKKFIEANL